MGSCLKTAALGSTFYVFKQKQSKSKSAMNKTCQNLSKRAYAMWVTHWTTIYHPNNNPIIN